MTTRTIDERARRAAILRARSVRRGAFGRIAVERSSWLVTASHALLDRRHCTACGARIGVGEQGLEIVSRTGASVIRLHLSCLDIWTEEATDGDGPPPR